MGYGWNLGGWGVVAAIVGMVAWIAIVVGLIALIVLGIRWLTSQGRDGSAGGPGRWSPPPGPRPDDPLEILRQRYARGEIDDEEYERRRKVLTGG